MSDESAPSSETPSTPPAEAKPRARRTPKPRPKKAAKTAKVIEDANPLSEVVDAPAASDASKFPEFSESPEAPGSDNDWAEPDTASSGAAISSENPKRKRRRKKGKGGNAPNGAPQNEGESTPTAMNEEPTESSSPQSPVQTARPGQKQSRLKLDPELLAKCAWKIYLAEISEEGVALVGDNDAKELSRRCFRLAEIFMEEETRRR